MIGVDSPELDESREDVLFWARMAQRFAFHHLYRKKVSLSFDWEPRDKYGRLLAYIRTAGGILFNESIIRQGFAAALLAFPFEEKYRVLFQRAEKEARQEGRGMWRKGEPPVVPAAEAAPFAGRLLIVRFTCLEAELRRGFVYLKAKGAEFEALIPRESMSLFPEWRSFPGRDLAVKGFLEVFKGIPQTIVYSPVQLTAKSSKPPAAAP